MAAVIGSLRADLSARIADFQTNMNKAGDLTAGFANQFKRSAAEASRSATSIGRSSSNIVGSTRSAEQQIVRSSDNIRRAMMASASALAIGFSVEGVRRSADEWTRYTNSLRVAGLEGDKLSATQQTLYLIAQRNGVAVEGLGGLYGKAAQTADQLGASEADLMRFVSGTSAALRIQGKDSAASAGAMLQLTQLLGGVKVQAQEYNSLIDGMYPLLQAVAAGNDRWGGSVAKLTADVKDSKVTVKDFFDAALKGFGGLEAKAARTALTTSSSMQILQNAWSKYIGQTDAALGASARFEQATRAMAENLDDIIPALAVLATAMAGSFIGNLRVGEQGINQWAAAQAKATAELITGSRILNANAVANMQAAQGVKERAMADQWAAIATAEAAKAERDRLSASVALLAAERQQAETALRNATTARERTVATRALATASRDHHAVTKLLVVAEEQLAAASAAEAAARVRTTVATEAYTVAQRAASAAATVAAGAARVLSAALAFFGGPIGVAITLVGVALLSMADAARTSASAGENATATLDRLQAKADETRSKTEDLAGAVRDQGSAAEAAKGDNDALAGSYEGVRVAALNAAEAIKYMTLQQRRAAIAELEKNRADLITTTSGGFFDRGMRGRIDSGRNRASAALGRPAGYLPSSQDINTTQGRAAIAAAQARLPQLTGTDRTVVRDWLNDVASFADTDRILGETNAALETFRDGLTLPTEDAPEPQGTGGGGGGGTSETASERRRREAAAKEAERDRLKAAADAREYDAELRRAQEDHAEAQAGITVSAEEELALQLQRVENTRAVRNAQIEGDGPGGTKRLTQAQVDQLTALNNGTAELQRQNLIRADAVRQEGELRAQALLDLEIQENLLQAQAQIARTAGERRDIELRLLDLQMRQERAKLEGVIASETATEAEKELARRRLAALEAEFGVRRQGVVRDTMGPLESYLDELNASAAQVNESIEAVAADGLKNLTDGITDAITGAKSLGEAFHDVAASIIRDLIQIAVKQMIVKPLANWMFGDSGGMGGNTGIAGQGGGGGFSWMNAAQTVMSFFGGFRAGGGSVMSGRAYMVGERGPELFAPGVNGSIIPNEAMGAGPGGGAQIIVYANDAVLTSWVEEAVERGYRRAVGDAVPMAVAAAQEVVPAELARMQNDRFI